MTVQHPKDTKPELPTIDAICLVLLGLFLLFGAYSRDLQSLVFWGATASSLMAGWNLLQIGMRPKYHVIPWMNFLQMNALMLIVSWVVFFNLDPGSEDFTHLPLGLLVLTIVSVIVAAWDIRMQYAAVVPISRA